jgi:hypothetical protein
MQKIYFYKFDLGIIKRNTWKKCIKNLPKKVIGRKVLHPVIKVKNSILHFFVNNFLRMRFFAAFSTDSKSASKFAFFIPILHLVLNHISTFWKLWRQTRTKRLKRPLDHINYRFIYVLFESSRKDSNSNIFTFVFRKKGNI